MEISTVAKQIFCLINNYQVCVIKKGGSSYRKIKLPVNIFLKQNKSQFYVFIDDQNKFYGFVRGDKLQRYLSLWPKKIAKEKVNIPITWLNFDAKRLEQELKSRQSIPTPLLKRI